MQIDPAASVGRTDGVSLFGPGTLRDPGRSPIDVLIDDLTETGATLRTAAALPVGTLVTLGIAGIGIQLAKIARILPGALAAEFVQPLDPRAVARAAAGPALAGVAIPQLPLRAGAPREVEGRADAVSAAAMPRSSIAGLSDSPSVVLSAQIAPAALIYGRGAGRLAPTPDDLIPSIDARALAGYATGRDAAPARTRGGNGLWLVIAVVLAAGLILLVL